MLIIADIAIATYWRGYPLMALDKTIGLGYNLARHLKLLQNDSTFKT